MGRVQPRLEGRITRGTTGANRLRRVDRWLVGVHADRLRSAADPLVVDLGYGAHPVTTLELAERLRTVRSDVEVVGLEIDPARVAAAQSSAPDGVSFALGGFELPLGGRRPVIVRALNVLRQYDEHEVVDLWRRMQSRLAVGGLVVEGTCDEVGRLAAWVALDADQPRTLTLSMRLGGLVRPSDVAARLPKSIIHRNVPGEPVHALLVDLDDAWGRHAAYASFGVRERWVRTVTDVATRWPVVGGHSRWRIGELSVDWAAVAPRP